MNQTIAQIGHTARSAPMARGSGACQKNSAMSPMATAAFMANTETARNFFIGKRAKTSIP